MHFKSFCDCCCSSSDAESVSNKSWIAGTVNKSFEPSTSNQPKAATLRSESSMPTNSTARDSMESDDKMSKIDLNLNIFENERFSDMSATIHKSNMNLNDIV